MMNAKKMAEITTNAKIGISNHLIQDIEPQLIAAAKKGENSITLNDDITLTAWDMLTQLGYTVETEEDRGANGYSVITIISW